MTEKDFPEDFDFELNPADKELEVMFGEAYLDSPDLSCKDIPQGLKENADVSRQEVADISHLIGKAIERAPVWSCQQAQERMLQHLEELVTKDPDPKVGWLDGWAWVKHRDHCYDPICADLDVILRMSKHLTPKEMKIRYEDLMKKRFPEK